MVDVLVGKWIGGMCHKRELATQLEPVRSLAEAKQLAKSDLQGVCRQGSQNGTCVGNSGCSMEAVGQSKRVLRASLAWAGL